MWKNATRTVFGEGSDDAEIMVVGEQPADREDPEGRPFVGPAGPLLDKALPEADIERNQVYVTNAVKHLKFEPRGKRRLRKRANASEIKICQAMADRGNRSRASKAHRRSWRNCGSELGGASHPCWRQSWQTGCWCSSLFIRLRWCAWRMRTTSAQATQVSSMTCVSPGN